ncbi:MAG TPA: LuxR C-terminal-related transcriptional regulator, partial [Anaerolineaceae bacterium]|nr:LuxR C-terminal-related transcriptional regulator [Anaerolineaceae bacterium]
TLLINELSGVDQPIVLVLEDYHFISSRPIHAALSFLIDHLPPALHVLLITRSDPPLPLARLRARNELNELRAADLRFTFEETVAFLREAIPFPLPDDLAVLLAERTEGWAAGLRLVVLALQGMKDRPEIEQYLKNLTGSQRPILDYLVADVFSAQPEEIQEFLLKTSILSRMNGPLGDAVTGRSDSARILEQLERTNLFLIPLDRLGHWYRYHALFAEAMQHYARIRLGEPALLELARKASQWYEANDMLAEAIEAALEARDSLRAADLIQRIIAPRLVQNEWLTLRRWMERLPEEALRTHPEICLTYATAILFTSDRHAPETKARVELPLEIAEQHWRKERDTVRLGEVIAFRSLVAWLQREFTDCFTYARQALKLLPESDRQWRGISMIMLGVDDLLSGRVNAARETIGEALKRNETAENAYGTLDSLLLLGETAYRQGDLRLAESLYRQVLTRAAEAPMDPPQAEIRLGRARLGLAVLAYEWNNLEQAESDAAQAYAAWEQFPEEDLLADSPIVLAQVKFARGETELAASLLNLIATQGRAPALFRFPQVHQIRFALASGDLAAARRLAADLPAGGAVVPLLRQEQEVLVRARLQIAGGEGAGALRESIAQLERLRAGAAENGRGRSEIELSIVLALAHNALRDGDRARTALNRALEVAQPQEYRRIFLDEGAPLAALLQAALPSLAGENLQAYARALVYLTSQEQAQRIAASGQEGPVEPLSEQERRVLRMLAAGRSNQEIAEELVISINTVKTHVKNIYGKLGVNSREAARQASRHLKLN